MTRSHHAGRHGLGRRQSRVKERRRRRVIVVLGILLLGVIASAAYLGLIARSFDAKSEKVADAFPEETLRPSEQEATNLLLLGSDSRESGAADVKSTGGDQRADTILLLHLPVDRKNVYVVSLMRDLWVPIPGHGNAKINSATNSGGVPLLVQTIESLLDQRIDHVALVDFDGFKGVVDTLGGVTVDVPTGYVSTIMPEHRFSAGPTEMDGDTALAFVRERYAYEDGDYQRVRNQQAFLEAVMRKVAQPAILVNPFRINELVNVFSPFVSVDEGFDSVAIASLALSMSGLRPENVLSFAVPTKGTGTSEDGQSTVLLDELAIKRLSQAMDEGTLPAFVKEYGLAD